MSLLEALFLAIQTSYNTLAFTNRQGYTSTNKESRSSLQLDTFNVQLLGESGYTALPLHLA